MVKTIEVEVQMIKALSRDTTITKLFEDFVIIDPALNLEVAIIKLQEGMVEF